MTPRIESGIHALLRCWRTYRDAKAAYIGLTPSQLAALPGIPDLETSIAPRVNELEAALLEYQLRGQDLAGPEGSP